MLRFFVLSLLAFAFPTTLFAAAVDDACTTDVFISTHKGPFEVHLGKNGHNYSGKIFNTDNEKVMGVFCDRVGCTSKQTKISLKVIPQLKKLSCDIFDYQLDSKTDPVFLIYGEAKIQAGLLLVPDPVVNMRDLPSNVRIPLYSPLLKEKVELRVLKTEVARPEAIYESGKSRTLSVYLVSEKKSQRLIFEKKNPKDNFQEVGIVWAGDIDGDKKIDLILGRHQGGDYLSFDSIELYLSTLASPGDFVK